MTGIYPAPILDKAGETQVNNISIVIRRDNGCPQNDKRILTKHRTLQTRKSELSWQRKNGRLTRSSSVLAISSAGMAGREMVVKTLMMRAPRRNKTAGMQYAQVMASRKNLEQRPLFDYLS